MEPITNANLTHTSSSSDSSSSSDDLDEDGKLQRKAKKSKKGFSSSYGSSSDSELSEEQSFQVPSVNSIKPKYEQREVDDATNRDKQETKFSYNEDDISKFASKIKDKAKYDRDFAGQMPLEEELQTLDEQTVDMQAISLFGVKLERTRDDLQTIDKQTR